MARAKTTRAKTTRAKKVAPKSRKSSAINLDKMSLKELKSLEVKVQAAIAAAAQRQRAEVLQKMDALAKDAGFGGVNELVGVRGRGRPKGSTVAPKYANPDNPSETWTGRGRKPNWLVAKLKKGGKMATFAI